MKTSRRKVVKFYRRFHGGEHVRSSSSPPPPLSKRLKTFATLWGNILARFGRITVKLGKLPYFKAVFPTVLMDIRLLLLTASSLVEKIIAEGSIIYVKLHCKSLG